MKNEHKLINIFKKSDDIIKYSKVYHGITNKQHKKYLKSDNTILLDIPSYSCGIAVNFNDLKTLIIDEKAMINVITIIQDCTATNIYVNNNENLGNITLPYEFCLKNHIDLRIIWNKKNMTKIDKINIIGNNFVKTIESKLNEDILIKSRKNRLIISIENYNSLITYEINEKGEIKEKHEARVIYQEDVKDDILDLREFEKFEKILFTLHETIKFDKVIINKSIIKNIDKFRTKYSNLKFNTLEIIDDNDMKLFQNIIRCKVNESTEIKRFDGRDTGICLLIKNNEDSKFIFLDDKDNVQVLDRENLIKSLDLKDAKIIFDENCHNLNIVYITKDKDNEVILCYKDGEYYLDEGFKKFLLLNKDTYLKEDEFELIKNDNWFDVIDNKKIKYTKIIDMYKEYLNYKKRLDKLTKLGLCEDAINYLIDKKINAIINTEIEETNKYEIDLFNKIGEEYKKVKKL